MEIPVCKMTKCTPWELTIYTHPILIKSRKSMLMSIVSVGHHSTACLTVLSRPLNFGAACLISCSQRRVNQHILRWLLENVILHHQVKMEVRDGGPRWRWIKCYNRYVNRRCPQNLLPKFLLKPQILPPKV